MPPLHRFRQRGLRVLQQHIPGPLTAIALSVRAGARFDGTHPGIAHMAEHMLFQGTTSLDQVALNRRAAELGGEHNADTGYENMSLTFEVFNEDVDAALELLAEQFYRSKVTEERFRKERRVVIDEIRGRMDDPAERLHRDAWVRFFRGSSGASGVRQHAEPASQMHARACRGLHAPPLHARAQCAGRRRRRRRARQVRTAVRRALHRG